jgi:phosphatidate cytidylyltransferase
VRILSGLLLLVLLAGVYVVDYTFHSVRATEAVLLVVVLLALDEAYGLFEAKGRAPARLVGAAACIALYALEAAWPRLEIGRWLGPIGLVVALFATSTRIADRDRALDRAASTIAGFLYVAWLPSAAIVLLELPGVEPRRALAAAYWIVLVAKATDIGGYLVGKSIGRHKLAEAVSPNKTVEGAIGGVVFSVGASVGLARAFGLDGFSPLFAAGAGALLSAAAQAGDLFESILKRSAGVKDSSAHARLRLVGGFLDLLDSLVLALPTGLLLVQACGL